MTDYSYFQLLNKKRQTAYEKEIESRAIIRNIFLSQDNESIIAILKHDLKKYMDDDDIANVFPFTLDDYIPKFIENLMQVHKKPPIIRWEEGVDENEKTALQELLDEVKFPLILQDTDIKMRFHNTILLGVHYYEELDRLYIDNTYNAGTCKVIPYEGFEIEPMIVIRDYIDKIERQKWVVWDRRTKDVFTTYKEPKWDSISQKIIADAWRTYATDKGLVEERNGEPINSYFPFVVYRYKDQGQGFWQNGLDSLCDMVRMLNVLFTIMGEDSIRETLRILIFPWEVTGIEGTGRKNRIKTGLRNPIYKPTTGENVSDTAQVVSADLYNEQIIAMIDKVTEIVSGLHNIGNLIKADIEKSLSGIAIRLKNEPILNQWAKDINIVREYDWYLIEKIIEVNQYHRDGKTKTGKPINPEIIDKFILDYQEPQIDFDDNDTYELNRKQWEDGISSPLEYIKKRNPEWSDQKAKEFIQNNKRIYEELFGITTRSFKPTAPENPIDIING